MTKYKLTDRDKDFLVSLKARQNESEMMQGIYADAMLRVIDMVDRIGIFKNEISIRQNEGESVESLEQAIDEMKADLTWLKNLTGDDFMYTGLEEA